MSACPQCHYFKSNVNETRRLNNGWVKRHRRCLIEGCKTRWYTFEIPREAVSFEDEDLREVIIKGASDE